MKNLSLMAQCKQSESAPVMSVVKAFAARLKIHLAPKCPSF